MNDLCLNLAIRQNKCQNSISVTTDNVYTNIKENSRIILSFGYVLEIISFNTNSVTIHIYNPVLLNTVSFNIPFNTFKSFDLPLYNGNYIILIGIDRDPCPCPNISR